MTDPTPDPRPAPGHARPVDRVAARVLLLDGDGRTLLFRGGDPGRPQVDPWWFTPGGGVDPGETLEDAARREVLEETGVRLTALHGPFERREIEFPFEGVTYRQEEHFYAARVPGAEPDRAGWTEVERRIVVDHRWWSAAELRATADRFFPADLPDLVDTLHALLAPAS